MTEPYEHDGFEDYDETTKDPGYYLIAATVIFCVASNLMLPCFVSLGHRYQKNRDVDDEDHETEQHQQQGSDSGDSDSEPGFVSGRDMGSVEMSDEYHSCQESASSTSSLSSSGSRTYHVRGLMGAALSPLANIEELSAGSTDEASQSVLMSLPDFYPPDDYDCENTLSASFTSSTGLPSSTVSAVSGVSTSVLDTGLMSPLKRRKGGRTRRRRGLEERRRLLYQENLESNRDMKAATKENGSDFGKASPSEPWQAFNNKYAPSIKTRSEPIPLTQRPSSRACELGLPRPTWSDLVTDDLTPDDAADADNPGVVPCTETLAIEDVDLCCGKHAWWRPVMLIRVWHDLLDLIDWDPEMKRLVQLALPFSAAAMVEGILELVAIALIGHYIGTNALASFTTVNLLVGLSSEFLGGVADTITVLCPHAIGAKNYFLAGQYVQISTILFTASMIPIIVLWFFAVRPTMIWFGFDEETAVMAQDYAGVIVFSELVEGVHQVFLNFLSVVDRELWATMVSIVQESLAALVILVSVLARDTTLTQVGVIYLIVALASAIVNFAYSVKKGWVEEYMKGMVRSFGFKNHSAVITSLLTAAPLSLGGLISYGEWEILAIFAGFLGPAEVATWGILGTLWDTIESTSEGVADAGEIRCAHHLGAGHPVRAKKAAYKCILLGVFLSSVLTSVVFILGENMAAWFTSDPTLQRMIIEILPLVGIGNITLTAGTVSWALVGSQGRYRLATVVSVIASWGVTMPLGALFTYVWRVNLQGLTSAVVVGYSMAGTTLTYILIMSNWARLSKVIVELNATNDALDGESSGSSFSSSSSPSSEE